MRCPFSLYKKKTDKGLIWYARFWNEKVQKYAVTRSTGVIIEGKKKRKLEAELKANEMLAEIRFEMEVADRPLISYLEGFWKPDSPYVKECANLRRSPLSVYYVHYNDVNVRLHIKPFPGFNGITLRELTAGLIRDWMIWASEKGMSGRNINNCLNTMRVPIHYVIDREELNKDPFRKIKRAADIAKEKGVLTVAERAKLKNTTSTDPRSKLAVLLGLLCGMRRGEVRGLQWGDIDNGLVHIIHNFVEYEGLKQPKCGKTRTMPYPDIVERAFEEVRKITSHPAPEAFVFESLEDPGKPMGETFFRNANRRELEAIGISATEQKKRNLTFHSLRHTFITLGRLDDGFSDLEMQAMAGHSSKEMMDHYTHVDKIIDFNAMREKLNRAVGM